MIELATALIWVAAAARFGVGPEALRSALFLTILLGIAMTDAREMVIPDQFTIVGAGIGLVLAALPATHIDSSPRRWSAPPRLRPAVGVKLGAEKALGKPALGVGDIHMMLLVGAFTGTAGMLLTLMLGSVLGVVVGVPLTRLRGTGAVLGTYLPLGTFLAMGAAIAHVWGRPSSAGTFAYRRLKVSVPADRPVTGHGTARYRKARA
jgi:leader peptidase (prepilin peptidase) / N-methyltransferase